LKREKDEIIKQHQNKMDVTNKEYNELLEISKKDKIRLEALNTEKTNLSETVIKITSELKQYQSDHMKHEETMMTELQTKYDELLSDNNKIQQKYDELNKKMLEQDSQRNVKQLEDESEAKENKNRKLKRTKSLQNELNSIKEENMNNITLLQTKYNEMSEEQKGLKIKYEALMKQHQNKTDVVTKKEYNELKQEYEQKKEELNDIKTKLNKATSDLSSYNELKQKMIELRKRNKNLMENEVKLTSELKVLNELNENNKLIDNKLIEENKKLKSNTSMEKVNKLQTELETMKTDYIELSKKYQSLHHVADEEEKSDHIAKLQRNQSKSPQLEYGQHSKKCRPV